MAPTRTDDDSTPERFGVVRLALAALSGLFVVVGGVIHLLDWSEHYKDLPAQVPGAWVVKIGFPLTFAASLLLAIALVAVAVRLTRFLVPVVILTVVFQLGSLAALVISHQASLFSWQERGYRPSAVQSIVVETLAVITLGLLLVLGSSDDEASVVDRS